ncbi:permease prefix domain 1-containing protein [Paenibacillus sp. GCM10012307]|uniref:Uncharacterized protein n=1 Tax=Paenibacillus roseus TaxID=2798579 RepID=A0A934J225_9BACL|nr:hypothetical protein [Paenibacillus roseus]
MNIRLKQNHDEVRLFLQEVLASIKSREAIKQVSRELECHIEDLVIGLMEEGIEEKEAVKRAIQRMGDAHEIGRQMSQIHRPVLDWSLLGLLALMVICDVLGLASIFQCIFTVDQLRLYSKSSLFYCNGSYPERFQKEKTTVQQFEDRSCYAQSLMPTISNTR